MKDGWAWVDTQPGQDAQILEAYRLADLVSNTLRLQVPCCILALYLGTC